MSGLPNLLMLMHSCVSPTVFYNAEAVFFIKGLTASSNLPTSRHRNVAQLAYLHHLSLNQMNYNKDRQKTMHFDGFVHLPGRQYTARHRRWIRLAVRWAFCWRGALKS